MKTGLDRLLENPQELRGRRYALLANPACVSASLEPIHLALCRLATPPTLLVGPEHGYYSVEQDMIASDHERDPWTGLPIHSLYGTAEGSLVPPAEIFEGLDLLVVDLQDVGARYYTYAATAVWAAEVALTAGCEVWVLDRPNPLGGAVIEGNRVLEGFRSFVGAFDLPARHGLTLVEIVALEGRRRGLDAVRFWPLEGWSRQHLWPQTGLPWRAPSPNLPRFEGALVYPGLCLVEATEISEGRGTTRPFELVGAPGIDPMRLAERLSAADIDGVAFLPTYFRPQYQKHAGEICGGVELVVTHPEAVRPFRLGIRLLEALQQSAPEAFRWRQQPYEFVSDRPAIDLLTGSPEFRQLLEDGRDLTDWIAGWETVEAAFREERREILIYPEDG